MFKYGTAIFEEGYRESVMFDDDYDESDRDAIIRGMSKQAMQHIDEEKEEAILRVNGMKEEWGTGVSTRVLIYNASGFPLTRRVMHDAAGSWSRYTPADRIEVGHVVSGVLFKCVPSVLISIRERCHEPGDDAGRISKRIVALDHIPEGVEKEHDACASVSIDIVPCHHIVGREVDGEKEILIVMSVDDEPESRIAFDLVPGDRVRR